MTKQIEVSGKLIKKFDLQTGTGKKGVWKKQGVLIETPGQYPNKIVITAWGDQVESLASLKGGDEVTCFVNIESQEYNSKWYTSVLAWKIQAGTKDKPETNVNKPAPAPIAEGSEDDLPF
jgi:hypothetical protein